MGFTDAVAGNWWRLLVGGDAALFAAAVVLWVAGYEPFAGLSFVVALSLPLAVLAVLLDGQS